MSGGSGTDCLNGCHDRDYGDDDPTPTVCTCTAEETLAAVERFNKLGISVKFVGAS